MYLFPSVIFAALVALTCIGSETASQSPYKCLFNHELLIITHNRTNESAYIQSFIEKLADTDVDAVMCCPTAWRTNLFPSDVDPTWKKYRPDQPLSKFPSWDYIMRYLHQGGDPVRDTLEACRKTGKAFFISYRMNDHHFVDDTGWPCHNDFWRDHPEYWLGDTDTSPYSNKDNIRVFNYMRPEVREHYFSIIRELCVNYDVDGVELDFQRYPKFFHQPELEQGTAVMTALVKRIRKLLDGIGKDRGKRMWLCARVPETIDKCRAAGLDISGWDAAGLVDMLNISPAYIHSINLDIEGFREKAPRAKLYGEMNYVTDQKTLGKNPNGGLKLARRYTTAETYRGSAFNLLSRGADGLSLFNFDYVPQDVRLDMVPILKDIMNMAFLKGVSKNYVITRNSGVLPANNAVTVKISIPDDTRGIAFREAVLRIETQKPREDIPVSVIFNGKPLERIKRAETELFPAVTRRNEAYPDQDHLKFYAVPLDIIVPGLNKIEIVNPNPKKQPCRFISLAVALYR